MVMEQNKTKKQSSLGIFSASVGLRTSRRFGSGVAHSEGFFRSYNHPWQKLWEQWNESKLTHAKGWAFSALLQGQVRRSVGVVSVVCRMSLIKLLSPPFKHIKTFLYLWPFCSSPELFPVPIIKSYKGLWKSLSPLRTKRWPVFPPHYLFLLWQDHKHFPLQTVVEKKWHKAVVQGPGLCSLPAIAKWGGCSTFLIKQHAESRISASEQSKGRIKHTFCSSACVVLLLQDGWRTLYKQHHRSVYPQKGFFNFRLCQSAPFFVLQHLPLKGIVVFTHNTTSSTLFSYLPFL